MKFVVTSSDDRQAGPAPVPVLLRRLLVTLGGLVAFGIFGIVLAGTASARTVSGDLRSQVDDSAHSQVADGGGPGNLLASVRPASTPLVDTVADLTTPVTPTLHAVAKAAAPAVDPVLDTATSVVSPVLRPVTTSVSDALTPVLHTVSPLVAPVTGPLLDATAPLLRPTSVRLGLAPVVSAIGGSGFSVGPVSSVPSGSVSPSGTPGGLASAESIQSDRPTVSGVAKTVLPEGRTVGGRSVMAQWPGTVPGSHGQSLLLLLGTSSGGTSSAGSGGGHGLSFGIADGRSTLLRHVLSWPRPISGVPGPQPGYVHGRDHPS
jgi:hypothetical protein